LILAWQGKFMDQILQYLQKHGERLDAEIAKAANLSLSKTRLYLAELAAKGEIVAYHSTRYEEGQKIEGIRCRLSGITPKPSPGRKKKATDIN
jgi:DNA-binding Lrp family transcriptional regulator